MIDKDGRGLACEFVSSAPVVGIDAAIEAIRVALEGTPAPAPAHVDPDGERFRWLIDDRNWNENEDTPSVCTSEDVHWGDKARALIDRHMNKD